MKFIDSYKKEIIFLLLIIGFSFIILRNMELLRMWTFGDLVSFPTDIKLTSNWILYNWRGEGLGFPNTPAINYYIIILLFSSVFGSFLAQKILFFSLFPIAFFAFYHFLKYFNFKSKVSLLGALFYSFNPVIISSFVGGAIGELMTFAVFPLFLTYILKFISENKFNVKHLAILTLISLFFWNSYVVFWYVILTIPLIVFICFRKYGKKLLRLFPLLLLISLVFLPTISGIISMNKGISEEKISFESTAKYTYGDISVLNVMRLAGNKGSAQAKDFLDYNTLNIYTILGFVLSLIVISSLFFIKKMDNHTKILTLFGSVCLIVIIGLLLLVRKYPNIVDISAIFSILRNPVKLMYPLVFSLTLLFSCLVSDLLSKFDKKIFFKNAILSAFILLIIFYNYPALDGTLGLQKIRGNQYFIEDKYYQLPKILENVSNEYKEDRILFLPWEYPTNLRIRSELPNYFGTPLGAQMIGIDILKVKDILEIINKNNTYKDKILPLFNVKYVVIDKTFGSYYEGQKWYDDLKKEQDSFVYYSQNSYWLSGNPLYFYSIFNINSNFELVYEDTNFAIFKNKIDSRKFFEIATNEGYNLITNYTQISNNLIKNPSFEEGIREWNIWPKDLVNLSNESKYGNISVVIYGQNEWFANIYQIISVKENTQYQFSFFTKGYNITDIHAKVIWYNQSEKLGEGDGYKTDYMKLYENNLTEGKWYNMSEIFNSPKGTKLARIQFLGSRLKNYTKTSALIDEVSFYEIAQQIEGLPEDIQFTNYTCIDPTLYKIKINATKPFMLAFAESYDPLWTARIDSIDGKTINAESIRPVPLYSVINGFWVDKTGQLEMTIEYEPQKWFYIGAVVSIATLIAGIGYLIYEKIKRIPDKKQQV